MLKLLNENCKFNIFNTRLRDRAIEIRDKICKVDGDLLK